MRAVSGSGNSAMSAASPEIRRAREDVPDLRGKRYAIVGGGLSGMAAAWYLRRRGAETHIVERDDGLGGRAGSARLGARTVTLGGKNIGSAYMRFRAFTEALGDYSYEHFGINSSRVLDGRVLTLDSSNRVKALRQFRGISAVDLARLGRLALTVRRDRDARYLDEEGCRRLARRYGGRSVEQAFGSRLREMLLRSLTVRVSAAEPDEVPMANVLPYIGMIVDSYDQLSGGMHEVVDAAAARSQVRLKTEARELIVEDGRVRGLSLASATDESAAERFDGIIVATHAHAAAELLRQRAPALAALLADVRYYPVTVVLCEYERPVFDASVRAMVFGAGEPLSNAGAYGCNDLNVVRYTFSGRAARSIAESNPDAESLARIAEDTLAPYADLAGNRRCALVARRFQPGLCAYHPDQAAFLQAVSAAARELPGLEITGDYLCGCSIEACFAAAERAVAAIEPTAWSSEHASGTMHQTMSVASRSGPGPGADVEENP